MAFITTTVKFFYKVAASSASDTPKDFDAAPSKMGQRDNSRTVGTEALMTVYHPQDTENLDPKMVRDRVANSVQNLNWKGLYSSKAADFLWGFASLPSSALSVFGIHRVLLHGSIQFSAHLV